ncbi:hypothetical protein A2943_00310 [Candidatus Adlerbacteria bacterium RIFCSPLOWO2_01_FULL_51_16]|uniref:Glycosyltransferase 2-like domain-containing protein n=1 Tax=Candidatus Adlerbacteria bacterium RIFCSPLOWO2_01_FULL_51_16 TaxID=1797243 RepID=A0A1F4XHC5_9BACT|nr:MAG: hypothetical protein A2943_00310 [Candidatus Adlerbacteria bacterium RIFCSPLOWO2_01_FULL_51_16]
MDIGALGVGGVLFIALYFEVFLLISFFEQKPKKKTNRAPRRYPSVSIVVPCFNEEPTLAKTIYSLLSLRYPKEKLEVIVVDDGSTDNTRAIGERFAQTHQQVRFFHKENGGKYTALNLGIKESGSELVGCLDADSFVAPDALCEVIKRFEEHPETHAVVPAMHVYKPRRILELMQAAEYTFGIFIKRTFDNLTAISVLPGPFSIYRREMFDRIGFFRHAHNTEDMEIAFRMHAHGLKIRNSHTASVYTTVPTTLRALLRQRTRWSQGFLQNSRDYSYMYANPRYGHFGLLVLPFGLTMFFGALYAAGYILYTTLFFLVQRVLDLATTGVPLALPQLPRLDWFFLETGVLTFLVCAMFAVTLFTMLIGKNIGKTNIGWGSLVAYFVLYGFVAPLWLARAAWGVLLARESAWR